MKKLIALTAALCLLTLAGCAVTGGTPGDADLGPGNTDPAPEDDTPPKPSPLDSIPFEGDELYAVAYLGYQETADLEYFAEKYLESPDLPVHYVSGGDYYLVIPRYPGTAIQLFENDLDTSQLIPRYEAPETGPFIVQCNASDVFNDVTIRLTHEGDEAEFSPFISLENGDVLVGGRGLLLTREE